MSEDSSSRPDARLSGPRPRNEIRSNGQAIQPPQVYLGAVQGAPEGSNDQTVVSTAGRGVNTVAPATESFAQNSSQQKVPWGPFIAVFYTIFVAFFGAQLLAAVAVMLWKGVFVGGGINIEEMIGTVPDQFVTVFVAEVLMVIVIGMYLRAKNATFATLGLGRFRWNYIVYAVVGFISYIVVYLTLASMLGVFSDQLNSDKKQELGFDAPTAALEYILIFISLVVLPPIAEEILMRGFMYTGLRTKMTFLPAAVITSIIFAAGHLQYGNGTPLLWVAAIDTFILSMVMCFVREKTGSVWPTIMIHALKNGLAFTLLYIVVA